ncbi:MAG: glycosyltransferase family 2 protein [Candidatus Gracilibacteria bacterium]|nr:glycosyltransferase family 2 protein [Candidatus Gracilibacteria bacterium]
MKKFAIIVVNYNSSNDLLETMESLDKFSDEIFDAYIVDNASDKDDLMNLENNLNKKHFLIKLEKNLGFAGGNNVAIKECLNKGYDYLFLLNPDTIIEDKNFFEIIEEQIIKEKADIIGPLIKFYPEKDKIYFAGGEVNKYTAFTKMVGKKEIDVGQFKENIEYDFITGCAMVIRKEVFERIGLLPEEYFLYFEETDFCMNAKNEGFKIIFTPKTYLYHKVSTSIKYLSNTYLYYMIRNYRIFASKHVKHFYLPIFWLYYLFVWCLGYLVLSIVKKNYGGYRYILKGLFNEQI